VQASWAREGLQGDRLSIENAAVVTATRRWPLLIDPQLQGVRWVKGKEGPRGLVVLQQGSQKFMETVGRCVEEGTPLLIENLPESIDAALEPLVSRQMVRRGRNMIMILAGREVTFHPDFKLYLHTKVGTCPCLCKEKNKTVHLFQQQLQCLPGLHCIVYYSLTNQYQ